MEGEAPPAPVKVRVRREPCVDPVKAQGILIAVNKKTRSAARLWKERWGFFSRIREIQEEEALKIGMSLDEYRAAVKSVSCQLDPKVYPVVVDPSPKPLPPTSAGMVGRRAQCPLERYGQLVKTSVDYPTKPPLPAGQIYNPYKQTMVFLGYSPPLPPCPIYDPFEKAVVLFGSVDGDPISYKVPRARSEVPDDMWAQPHCLEVMPLSKDNLMMALRT